MKHLLLPIPTVFLMILIISVNTVYPTTVTLTSPDYTLLRRTINGSADGDTITFSLPLDSETIILTQSR